MRGECREMKPAINRDSAGFVSLYSPYITHFRSNAEALEQDRLQTYSFYQYSVGFVSLHPPYNAGALEQDRLPTSNF